MNRRLRTLFVVVSLLALALTSFAVPRQCVVLEHFTNTSCGPCFTNNPALEAAVNDMGRDSCVKVSYHVNWPGPNDEFYLYNTSENQLRWNWYNVTGVPDLVIGNVNPAYPFSTSNIKQLVRTEFSENCPVAIESFFAYNLTEEPTIIHFSGRLNAESNLPAGAKLFVSLITSNVDPYAAPNGEDHIAEPFRDHSYHATQGLAITAVPGTPQEFTGTMTKNAAWDNANLEVVCFVQNTSTKEILQGEVTVVSPEYGFQSGVVSGEAQAIMSPTGGESGYIIELINVGTNDDVYDISLSANWPTGWTYSVEAQGGTPNPSHISVALPAFESTFLFVRVNPSGSAGSAQFTMSVASQGNNELYSSTSWRLMAGLDVLVIDADDGEDYETYYTEALAAADDNLGVVWGWWDTSLNELDAPMFDGVDVLVWLTGDQFQETLGPIDQLNLQDYLDLGGSVLLSGQGMGQDMRNDQFYIDYMKAQYLRNFPIGSSVTGVTGTIADGMAFSIVSGTGANNQNRQSSIVAREGANLLFNYDQDYQGVTQGAGLTVDNGTYRLIYLGFGFEAVATADARAALMEESIGWLMGGTDAPEAPATLPAEFSLAQNYPNPFNPETNIPFALPVRSNVTLKVYDLLGREVATLADRPFEAGVHTVSLNGSDLSSGVYFYTLKADGGSQNFSSTRKLVLLK
jgi:hypothetical protein